MFKNLFTHAIIDGRADYFQFQLLTNNASTNVLIINQKWNHSFTWYRHVPCQRTFQSLHQRSSHQQQRRLSFFTFFPNLDAVSVLKVHFLWDSAVVSHSGFHLNFFVTHDIKYLFICLLAIWISCIYTHTYMCFLLIYRSSLYLLNLFLNAFIASIFLYFVACLFLFFFFLLFS